MFIAFRVAPRPASAVGGYPHWMHTQMRGRDPLVFRGYAATHSGRL